MVKVNSETVMDILLALALLALLAWQLGGLPIMKWNGMPESELQSNGPLWPPCHEGATFCPVEPCRPFYCPANPGTNFF